MAKSQPKITLSESRDIPFNKLVLSQSNVRRIKAGVAIEELAEDIARRTLLQSLTVRPVLTRAAPRPAYTRCRPAAGAIGPWSCWPSRSGLPARRRSPASCASAASPRRTAWPRTGQRALLHPLDQFRAFLALREKGKSEEEVAAAFFVSVNVVRQRLRLSLAFGDMGGGIRRLVQIVFGLSIAFAATSFFLTFFSFAGGALID